MTLEQRLKPVGETLAATGLKTFHYWRANVKEKRYIIWAEDDEYASLDADNEKIRQGIHGTVDLFTKQEYDPAVDLIQEALKSISLCGWRLNYVQYEQETNLIHHEWEFNLG